MKTAVLCILFYALSITISRADTPDNTASTVAFVETLAAALSPASATDLPDIRMSGSEKLEALDYLRPQCVATTGRVNTKIYGYVNTATLTCKISVPESSANRFMMRNIAMWRSDDNKKLTVRVCSRLNSPSSEDNGLQNLACNTGIVVIGGKVGALDDIQSSRQEFQRLLTSPNNLITSLTWTLDRSECNQTLISAGIPSNDLTSEYLAEAYRKIYPSAADASEKIQELSERYELNGAIDLSGAQTYSALASKLFSELIEANNNLAAANSANPGNPSYTRANIKLSKLMLLTAASISDGKLCAPGISATATLDPKLVAEEISAERRILDAIRDHQ